MKVAVVFEPDPDLGSDPLDEAKQPRRLGEFLDSDRVDVLLIYREVGEQFEGGSRTNILSSGIWENLTVEQIDQALAPLFEDGLDS
jgi:hypothetical protein